MTHHLSHVILCAAVAAVVAAGCSSTTKSDNAAKDPASLSRPVSRLAPVPPVHPETVDLALRQRATDIIKADAVSPDPYIRAHVIEACRRSMPVDGRPIILKALSDVNVVCFAGLVAAGELRVTDAYQPALQIMNTTTNRNIRLAAIFCLHRLGDKRFSHEFEKAANDPDRSIRANTAMLLGLMGEPSAARVLEFLKRDNDPTIVLQANEGLWRLHQTEALEALVTATISRYADDQVIAAMALAEPRDPRVIPHLDGMLTTAYPQVNLTAARALGMLGRDDGYGVAMDALKSEEPALRYLGALALGSIGRADAQTHLAKLLEDKDPDARLAGATAILQLHN